MWEDGKSRWDVSRFVRQQYSSIQRVIYSFKSTGVYTSKPRSGSPSKLTIREKQNVSRRPCVPPGRGGRGSLVVKVSQWLAWRGWHVMSSRPVPLKTRRVGGRCTLNLSRAQTSSRWCGVVVRRGGASSGVVLVT
ncbi:uncharacterized protein TNCV_2939121 [Trichonephila clavipes]|nr:uncharacterized protein TNCV_2939121 [Trichonephila clavipes]